jgi:hypothetical protein
MTYNDYLAQLVKDKVKVRVTFKSGNKKWGWVHLYNNTYYLTRGNRVGFSMDTAETIEEMTK